MLASQPISIANIRGCYRDDERFELDRTQDIDRGNGLRSGGVR